MHQASGAGTQTVLASPDSWGKSGGGFLCVKLPIFGQYTIVIKCPKKRLSAPSCVKNARNTQSISALFALVGTNIRLFRVLRSFEIATFLRDKQKNSRNAVAFFEFSVQYWRKEAVQNQFITMAYCPMGSIFIGKEGFS